MTESAKPIPKPIVEIEYCPGCKWLLRAGWMAQELLSTFEDVLGGVEIMPSETSGKYEVRLRGGAVLWDRKAEGGFPEIKVLKQRVRDAVDANRDLGHADR